jgi:hypothetical protein
MTGRRIRRAAALAALACTLALAAPAHAAGWRDLTVAPGWFEDALQRISRLWTGDREPARQAPATEKCGHGTNPDGCPQAVTPPAPNDPKG